MSKILVICAHPDDEALWFAGPILRNEATVVCVTCGSEEDKEQRRLQFIESCELLGVSSYRILHFPDITFKKTGDLVGISRIDIAALTNELRLINDGSFEKVYTHGPFGEVNEHPHHQDVCMAVHMVFSDVYSIAWNQQSDENYILTNPEYQIKKRILGTIYFEEYRKIRRTYQIGSIEQFVRLSSASIELYYWAIANFGDRHEMLGEKYPDMWGYAFSPYEQERHQALFSLICEQHPTSILELGAHEGRLSKRLCTLCPMACTENSKVHRERLESLGFNVVSDINSNDYDLTVVASVLDYMEDPIAVLRSLSSRCIIVEVIISESSKKMLDSLLPRYELMKEVIVLPRWEPMFHGVVKEKLEIYRLGAIIRVYERI